jgi:hypothetical protein|tara:strand:+ start:486 stop:737 length:252 start_codon:yes stop_codon:yes gene_type:complete
MALQGKITASRGYQAAGVNKKVIMARNVSVSGVTSQLAALTDVDVSARSDGSIIQWDGGTGKFKVKPTMEDTNSNTKINGGSF